MWRTPPSKRRRAGRIVAMVVALTLLGACASRVTRQQLMADAEVSGLRAAGKGSVAEGGGERNPERASADSTPDSSPITDLKTPAARAAANGPALPEETNTTLGSGAGAHPGFSNGAEPQTGNPRERTEHRAQPTGEHDGRQLRSAPSPTARCAAQKSPVVLGTVGIYSGVVGAGTIAGTRAVQAWAASLNAKGGVACHPVKYIVADDSGDPSKHQALVRRFVEDESVLAFVYMAAPLTGHAAVNYLTTKRVPVIGSEMASPWFYESPMYFPQASSGDELLRAMIATAGSIARSEGKSKLATLSCVEAPICSRLHDLAPSEAGKHGLTLVYAARVSLVQPDFTSQCQAARSAGAEIMAIALDGNAQRRIARSCRSVNYRIPFVTGSVAAFPEMSEDLLVDGLAVAVTVAPWMTTGKPAIEEYRRTVRRYSPGTPLHTASMAGWVSAKLFELAAAHGLPDTPTSEAVLDGLWSIKGQDLGGLTEPLTFTSETPATPRLCYWIVRVHNREWISPDGGQRICTST